MATEAFPNTRASSGLRTLVDRDAVGALILAAAIPFLFFHERYQPEASVGVGATTIDARLSDVAVLVVLIAAVVAATRHGIARLGAARWLWIWGAVLFAWLAFQTFRPVSLDDALFDEHLVSFLKLVEYGLLALAVPLLVRRSADLTILLGGLVLWAGVAVAVALLQFFGVDIFGAWNAGWRQPSFLGHHDLAALSAVALALATAGIVSRRRELPAHSLFWLALVAGVLGLVVAGSLAAAGGLAVGVAVLWLAARVRFRPRGRQTLALVAIVAVVAAGVVAVRGDALEDFLRFIGVRGDNPPVGVETYSQRTVLAYIGLRIARDNPVLGVGWQRSSRPEVFEPYVDDARRRFPDVVDLAFPAAGREWGVQNLYIQVLADAGVIGLVLLLLVGASALTLAWRAAARAPTPWAVGAGLLVVCALLTLAGEWSSLGIVAGIPLQAASCLLLGLAAAGAAAPADADG
ncbi:MAG TPA: O-antigen ligase family protein [Gaiellaceae bacterium]|nr:O-antigen ligase family protein [Gaiellaceae bacterium]